MTITKFPSKRAVDKLQLRLLFGYRYHIRVQSLNSTEKKCIFIAEVQNQRGIILII